MTTRFLAIITVLILAFYVLMLIRKEKLELKYALLWFVLSIILILFACFPSMLTFLSFSLGFELTSNFLFFIAIFFLLLQTLSLSSTVSKQQQAIKNLSQALALLKHQLDNGNGGCNDDEL